MELDRVTELAGQPNGVRVVLLVLGDRYAEVVRKEGDALSLAYWNRYTVTPVQEMDAEGFKPVSALRVMKANGTIMYLVEVEGGTDLYSIGKRHPAVRNKR